MREQMLDENPAKCKAWSADFLSFYDFLSLIIVLKHKFLKFVV